MKLFHKWLKPSTAQARAIEEIDPTPVGVRVRPQFERSREYSEDSTFSWFGVDHADSSIFESDDSHSKGAENDDDVPATVLKPVTGSARHPGDNEGFDPYNTGHFESSKK